VYQTARCFVRAFSTRLSLSVGCVSQPSHEIAENILSVWAQFDAKIPGGCANVRSLYVSSSLLPSVLLPIYVNLDSANLVRFGASKRKARNLVPVVDELTTVSSSEGEEDDVTKAAVDGAGHVTKVKVMPDGHVSLIAADGREKPVVLNKKKRKTEKKKKKRLSGDRSDAKVVGERVRRRRFGKRKRAAVKRKQQTQLAETSTKHEQD